MSELIDTSALVLGVRDDRVRGWLAAAVAKDDVVLCDIVALEYLMGARNEEDYARTELALAGFRWVDTEPEDWRQARDGSVPASVSYENPLFDPAMVVDL